LKKQLDDYIKRNQLEAKLTTEVTDLGLMIKISDSALFDSGKAEVRPEGRLLAKEISRLLVPNSRKVTVSGHTDNVPIRSAAFASNWELSAARAINFMKIIMENPVLASNPKRFSATAYGEYQPIASNETPEGRAANRRVEVAILRDNPKITLPNVGELQ
jgi:chemotaxis protein MotB